MLNFTPHNITLRLPDGTERIVPPTGKIARVETNEQVGIPMAGIPVVLRSMGGVYIPSFDTDEPVVLVSSLVLEAAKAQQHPLLHHLYAPDTGPTAVRENGQIVAVTRLVK